MKELAGSTIRATAPAPLACLPLAAWGADAPGVGAGSVAQTLLGLVVVLALVFGLAWLMRRFGPPAGGAGRLVKPVASASLGARERVVVVEIGERWLVLGVAPGRVSRLAMLARAEVPDAAPPAAGFGALLERALQSRARKDRS